MATVKTSSTLQKPVPKVAVTKTTIASSVRKPLKTSSVSTKTNTVSTIAVQTIPTSRTSTLLASFKSIANKGTTKADNKPKPVTRPAITKPPVKSNVTKVVADSTQKTNVTGKVPLGKEPSKSIKKPPAGVISAGVKSKSTVLAKSNSATKNNLPAETKAKTFVMPSTFAISKVADSKAKTTSKAIKSSIVGSVVTSKIKQTKSTSAAISFTKPETGKLVSKSTTTSTVAEKLTTMARSEAKPKSTVIQKTISRTTARSRITNVSVVRPQSAKNLNDLKTVTKTSTSVEIRDADSTSSFNGCSPEESLPQKLENDQILNFDENRAYEVAEQLIEVMKMQEDSTVDEEVVKSIDNFEPEFQNLEENGGAFGPVAVHDRDFDVNLIGRESKILTGVEEKMDCNVSDENIEEENVLKNSETEDLVNESFVFELPMKDKAEKDDNDNDDVENAIFDPVIKGNASETTEELNNWQNIDEERENGLSTENTAEADAEYNSGTEEMVENMEYDQKIIETSFTIDENANTCQNESKNAESDQEIVFEKNEDEDAECNQETGCERETNENFEAEMGSIESEGETPLEDINEQILGKEDCQLRENPEEKTARDLDSETSADGSNDTLLENSNKCEVSLINFVSNSLLKGEHTSWRARSQLLKTRACKKVTNRSGQVLLYRFRTFQRDGKIWSPKNS